MSKIWNMLVKIKRFFFPVPVFENSEQYWIDRYKAGGNSGAGSYKHLAEFKAEIINPFVEKNKIESVAEFGCGDGNQLSYFNFKTYTGYDISSLIVEKCREMYKADSSKKFFLSIDRLKETVDLSLSLDVIYHLVEDDAFHSYMNDLFNSSHAYVIIYSSNYEDVEGADLTHVKHREFTRWIEKHKPQFKLIQTIPNKYPTKNKLGMAGSHADFYIFRLAEAN